MHDNQQADSPVRAPADPAATFALADHRVVSLTGRDAAAFAQSQFMNDVTAITDGHWQWNGWLTPKGRVIALFALLRIDAETVWLLLPDADPMAIVAALQRYVFRSKVAIAVREGLHVSGAFEAPISATGARIGTGTGAGIGAGNATGETVGIELDLGADGGPRRLRIGVHAAGANDALLARWAAFDLQHGLPRLPASQAEQWTPQQLSLDRLNAFSVKKGCYPGQEIVARTHFLGKAKRGLALVEGDRPLTVGAPLHAADGDSALGTLVACASIAAGRHLALAVVPLQREAGALVVEGMAVREIDLREGLAR